MRQQNEKVTGIVLKAEPIGEYDRRLVLLTGERGKISAFARGARRPHSPLLAATNPFCFGSFSIFFGRSAYSLSEAQISNFFAGFRDDYEAAYYGCYLLELADYYGHENNDERQLLNLLYQSLKALCHPAYERRLVRHVFEIKALVINGEYPGILPRADGKATDWDDSTIFCLNHIVDSSIGKLFNFTLSATQLAELGEISAIYQSRFMDRPLKSLDILDKL